MTYDQDPRPVHEVFGQRVEKLRVLGMAQLELRQGHGVAAPTLQLGGDALVQAGIDDQSRGGSHTSGGHGKVFDGLPPTGRVRHLFGGDVVVPLQGPSPLVGPGQVGDELSRHPCALHRGTAAQPIRVDFDVLEGGQVPHRPAPTAQMVGDPTEVADLKDALERVPV